MRQILAFFSILFIFNLFSYGQENRGPLPVSSSLIAVKITDPDAQITKLMPIVQLVDKAMSGNPRAPKGISLSKSLAFLAGMLKGVPGIKSDGTFWILVMPTKFSQKNPEGQQTAIDDNSTPTFLVFPLSDPDVFQKFLESETTKANKDMPRGMVYGDYALLGFEGVVPAFSQVDFDLLPVSRRDLVMMIQWQNYEFANNALKNMDIPFPPGMFPGAQPNMKMGEFLKKYETNILRMEFGVNMVNNVLDVEMLNVPIAGGQLEEDLATKFNNTTAKQLLRYMPATVFYAAAGGPLVESSPGTGYQLNKFVIDLMRKSLSDPSGTSKGFETVIQAYEEISRRCVNGRAISWVPNLQVKEGPSVVANFPTFVAVYSTSSINKDLRTESQALIRKMFDSMFPPEKDSNGKILYNTDNTREVRWKYPFGRDLISAITSPNVEKYGTNTVDVIKLYATASQASKSTNWYIKTQSLLEFRFAYISDKLLITIGGPDSKIQMANLISRVNGKLAGLTSSPRFIAQTQNMRGNVKSIEILSPRDLAKTITSNIDAINIHNLKEVAKGSPKNQKMVLTPQQKSIMQFQKSYPPLTTYNVILQDANDGCERFIYRIPLEQIRYLVSTIINTNNPPTTNKTPVVKSKTPVKKTTRRR